MRSIAWRRRDRRNKHIRGACVLASPRQEGNSFMGKASIRRRKNTKKEKNYD